MIHIEKISIDNIKQALKYAPFFVKERVKLYSWISDGKSETVEYNSKVLEFIDVLRANNLVQSIVWTKLEKEVKKYIDYPDLIERADIDVVVKLFTYHIRKERYKKGHIAEMIEKGQFRKLLTRLKYFKQDPRLYKKAADSRRNFSDE